MLDLDLEAKLTEPIVKDFFTVLAICNTVVVSSYDGHSSQAGHAPPQMESCNAVMAARLSRIKYEAESPDEAALVKVCLLFVSDFVDIIKCCCFIIAIVFVCQIFSVVFSAALAVWFVVIVVTT